MNRFALYGFSFLAAVVTAQDPVGDRDAFAYIGQVNKASIVMLNEIGLVSDDLACTVSVAIEQVIREGDAAGATRSGNYLHFEKRLLEIAGAEASIVHVGRSRQDLHGTVRRMLQRDVQLACHAALLDARAALLELASRHVETVVPAYTHGVPAQPTTLAHVLIAFSAAFDRDTARMQAAYRRHDLSPMGAAALGTSGYPLDRRRMAELLGFRGYVDNSFDANFVSSSDYRLECAAALSISAVAIGQFVENIHTQYHDPAPWILLDDSATSVSTIMPQKRNPLPLERLRMAASAVVGEAHVVTLQAHNTSSGMHDYRPLGSVLALADRAIGMYRSYAELVGLLRVDAARAIEELERGFSTTTEIADTLFRDAGVPFRTAHHFASELTRFGRSTGTRLSDVKDADLRRIFAEAVGGELPLDVAAVRSAMDPRSMVRNRKGAGGPQPAEVRRMLAEHRESLTDARRWQASTREALTAAATELERRFGGLR